MNQGIAGDKPQFPTSATISADETPVSSLSSLMTACLGSSPSSIPPCQKREKKNEHPHCISRRQEVKINVSEWQKNTATHS